MRVILLTKREQCSEASPEWQGHRDEVRQCDHLNADRRVRARRGLAAREARAAIQRAEDPIPNRRAAGTLLSAFVRIPSKFVTDRDWLLEQLAHGARLAAALAHIAPPSSPDFSALVARSVARRKGESCASFGSVARRADPTAFPIQRYARPPRSALPARQYAHPSPPSSPRACDRLISPIALDNPSHDRAAPRWKATSN